MGPMPCDPVDKSPASEKDPVQIVLLLLNLDLEIQAAMVLSRCYAALS